MGKFHKYVRFWVYNISIDFFLFNLKLNDAIMQPLLFHILILLNGEISYSYLIKWRMFLSSFRPINLYQELALTQNQMSININ